MSGVSGINHAQLASPSGSNPKIPKSVKTEQTAREAFQDFVAGTFYKQMFKSLRKMHDKPAYFHGGQAEEMFQSQMDQMVAEDLAREQGNSFADPLFSVFAQKVRIKSPPSGEEGGTS